MHGSAFLMFKLNVNVFPVLYVKQIRNYVSLWFREGEEAFNSSKCDVNGRINICRLSIFSKAVKISTKPVIYYHILNITTWKDSRLHCYLHVDYKVRTFYIRVGLIAYMCNCVDRYYWNILSLPIQCKI